VIVSYVEPKRGEVDAFLCGALLMRTKNGSPFSVGCRLV